MILKLKTRSRQLFPMNNKRKASSTLDQTCVAAIKKNLNSEKQQKSFSSIDILTDEVLLHVFSWLPFESIHNCMLVCRKWNRVSSDNKIWRELYLSHFLTKNAKFQSNLTLKTPENPTFDWKKCFKTKFNWRRGSSKIRYVPLQDPFDINPKARSKRVIVAARNQLVATVNNDCLLTVYNCERTFYITLDIKEQISEESLLLLGRPSTLTINPIGSIRIAIGFTTGSFIICSLEGLKSPNTVHQTEDKNMAKLVIKHVAAMDYNSQYGAIRHIVQRKNVVAAYTDKANILLYSISSDGDTHTVSVLKSYIDPHQPVSLSIRSFHFQRLLFCISVAYCQQNMDNEWAPYIQEILCAPDGSIVNTRMSSNTNGHLKSVSKCSNSNCTNSNHPEQSLFNNSSQSIHGNASPVSISYNHPFLLAGFNDNTISYYHVRSAECCLEIQPKGKLWGHTRGIKHVMVKPGGIAISVSRGFPEIRWWDLGNDNTSRPFNDAKSTLIKIPPTPNITKSQSDSEKPDTNSSVDKGEKSSNGWHKDKNTLSQETKEIHDTEKNEYLDFNEQRTGNFFTFDDDMVLVEVKIPNKNKLIENEKSLKSHHQSEQRIMLCDFR